MKYFRIYLSNKTEVDIDENDYKKITTGLNTGSFVQLKNAIVNPSFVSHIIPISSKEVLDREAPPRRVEGYIDEKRGVYVVTKDITPAVIGISDKFKKE